MNTETVHAWVKGIRRIWPLFPAAFYLLGFLIVAIVYLVGMSFSAVGNGGSSGASLSTVLAVLQMPRFREALINTVAFVLIGTPLELIVGLALALMLHHSFHFRGLMRSVFVIPIAIPALVTATLLFILFDYPGGHANDLITGKYPIVPMLVEHPINWRGSKTFALGVSLLGKVWRDMTISMLILLAGLSSVEPELIDAARTMGAGVRQRLRHIILPLIMPSISAVVLLRSIEMWKEFIFPFVLAGKHNLLGTLIESLYNNWGRSHEAAVVALVLVICIGIGVLLFSSLLQLLRRVLAAY
ncbi:MAG: ABC transporter permease subunit [Chitinivibrionales bacterium]|nr:ABC transporter permease subunit [Chitinivibrionales bacterium]